MVSYWSELIDKTDIEDHAELLLYIYERHSMNCKELPCYKYCKNRSCIDAIIKALRDRG